MALVTRADKDLNGLGPLEQQGTGSNSACEMKHKPRFIVLCYLSMYSPT